MLDDADESDRTNFNCTIQELKRENRYKLFSRIHIFQLHHTGIKTRGTKGR